MRLAVDPARHRADHRQASFGRVMPQPLRSLISVSRRAARTDDPDGTPAEPAGVSAHVKKRRRIVDFLKPLRIFRIAPMQRAGTQFAGLYELGLCIFVRMLGLNCASRGGGQVACLELSQRSAESVSGRAELAQQFPGGARAEARRHRE